jgi:phosphotransferase system HPr (HPr) family protein
MTRRKIDLSDIDCMTSRAAAMLVQAACKYSARILIEQGSKVVNAKSLMGVLSLSAKSMDSLYLVLDGDDEEEAYNTIQELIRSRFSVSA